MNASAVNEFHHNAVTVNAPNPAIQSYTGGHLQYQQGYGVRKIEETDCAICEHLGLNDGQWHPVSTG